MPLPLTNARVVAEHAGAMLTADDVRFIGSVPAGTAGRLVGPHPNPRLDGWLLLEVDPADAELGDYADPAEVGEVLIVPVAAAHIDQPRQTCANCLRTVGTLPDEARPWLTYRTEVVEGTGSVTGRRLFHYCTDAAACQAHRDAKVEAAR
jgi:hypothetical protein